MFQAPELDSQLDFCIKHDGLCPGPLRESTTTPIKQPFTTLQTRSQYLISLELVEELGEKVAGNNVSDPLEPSTGPSQTVRSLNSEPELSQLLFV